jgi:hypothetical protein
MTTPTFEDEVTRGQAQWLTSVKYDPGTREFIVGLTHDPESAATQRVVYFAEVQSVSDSWIDRDFGCMEGLLGVHEKETNSGIRYTLVTDQREIALVAGKRARIGGRI